MTETNESNPPLGLASTAGLGDALDAQARRFDLARDWSGIYGEAAGSAGWYASEFARVGAGVKAVALAAVAAERERCAVLCEGIAEVTSHSSLGARRVAGMTAAASCAKLIRVA